MGFQGVTTDYRRVQVVTEGNKGLQGVKGGNRGLQGVTRGYIWLQMVTRCYRGYKVLQEVTGVAIGDKRLYGVAKGYRS